MFVAFFKRNTFQGLRPYIRGIEPYDKEMVKETQFNYFVFLYQDSYCVLFMTGLFRKY